MTITVILPSLLKAVALASSRFPSFGRAGRDLRRYLLLYGSGLGSTLIACLLCASCAPALFRRRYYPDVCSGSIGVVLSSWAPRRKHRWYVHHPFEPRKDLYHYLIPSWTISQVTSRIIDGTISACGMPRGYRFECEQLDLRVGRTVVYFITSSSMATMSSSLSRRKVALVICNTRGEVYCVYRHLFQPLVA